MTLKRFALLLFLLPCLGFAQANETDPVTLDGSYDMEIDIGGKIFHDVMDFKGKNGPIDIYNFYLKPITGSITVPNVFTAPLEGSAHCYVGWVSKCGFNFSIVAIENGKSFVVKYTAKMNLEDHLKLLRGESKEIIFSGEAKLEDGSLLGKFRATRTQP